MRNILLEQTTQENKVIQKAKIIAVSKRVRRTSNRTIWCVQSESTPGKFYRVMFDELLNTFTCDCAAYNFTLKECKHVYACALVEGGYV